MHKLNKIFLKEKIFYFLDSFKQEFVEYINLFFFNPLKSCKNKILLFLFFTQFFLLFFFQLLVQFIYFSYFCFVILFRMQVVFMKKDALKFFFEQDNCLSKTPTLPFYYLPPRSRDIFSHLKDPARQTIKICTFLSSFFLFFNPRLCFPFVIKMYSDDSKLEFIVHKR